MSDALQRRQRPYFPPLTDVAPEVVLPRDYWLETPVTVVSAVGTASWAWFDASKHVPDGATALMLYGEYNKTGNNLSVLEVRSSVRLPAVKVFNVTGPAAGAFTGSLLFFLPLDQRDDFRRFQYEVTNNSFGGSLSLKLMGYRL